MREYLFRGKRVDSGEWVYGYLSKHRNVFNRVYTKITPYDPIEGDAYVEDGAAVIPETVGQFTGIIDKNGKKIFEGDIVKEPDVIHEGRIQIKGDISQIMNLYGCLCVVKNNHVKNFLGNGFHKVEVIGNIYDNLVKLKGEDE